VNQFLNFFEQRPQYNNRPILFMLDEFPRLGKIPAILDGVAVLRDKKITVCPIIQSLAQLDYIYGDKARKIIVDNCSYKVVLSAEDADTQEYFSKMYGTYEKPQKSSGESFIGPLVLGRNKGVTEVEKRKIKPEEFATLPSTGKLALITPFGNSKVAKRPYYIPYKPPPKPQKKTVIERMFQALRRVFNSINRLIQ